MHTGRFLFCIFVVERGYRLGYRTGEKARCNNAVDGPRGRVEEGRGFIRIDSIAVRIWARLRLYILDFLCLDFAVQQIE